MSNQKGFQSLKRIRYTSSFLNLFLSVCLRLFQFRYLVHVTPMVSGGFSWTFSKCMQHSYLHCMFHLSNLQLGQHQHSKGSILRSVKPDYEQKCTLKQHELVECDSCRNLIFEQFCYIIYGQRCGQTQRDVDLN